MKPNRTNQNKSRDIGFIVLLAVLIIATIFTVNNTEEVEKTKYSEIVDYFEQEKVQKFTAEDTKLTLTLRPELGEEEGKTVTYDLYSFSLFYNDLSDLIREQHDKGIIEEYDINEGFVAPWWLSFVPYLIIMIIFMALWYSMMNRAGGAAGGVMKFSKARTRTNADGKDKKTFNDVAGCEEEKQELAEIVDFLKDPKRYTQMGARIPKGVLLVGPPGTGKTLLAKAVAGEANVPFLSISGSDFVELYVGVGAGRVRDLFEQAKKAAPAQVASAVTNLPEPRVIEGKLEVFFRNASSVTTPLIAKTYPAVVAPIASHKDCKGFGEGETKGVFPVKDKATDLKVEYVAENLFKITGDLPKGKQIIQLSQDGKTVQTYYFEAK